MRHQTLQTERRVLDLLLDGFSNKQIAAQLGIGQRTVECHRARINKRYGAKSPVQLGWMVACERMEAERTLLGGCE